MGTFRIVAYCPDLPSLTDVWFWVSFLAGGMMPKLVGAKFGPPPKAIPPWSHGT
jgi:hypothetical protein